jgi:hypothetical protein
VGGKGKNGAKSFHPKMGFLIPREVSSGTELTTMIEISFLIIITIE